MLKVEELETFLDLILSVLTDSKKRFTKSLENYIFAEASIAQRRQQLTKTFDAAKVRLAYFPDSIRETSARVEELAEKVETLRSSLAAMKVAVAEKEEALSKLVDEKDEELVQIPLEEARKGYQATIKAVQTLKKDDIEEMKASILPPPEVLQISEALCIIFDKPNNWLEAKKLISSNTFVQKVVAFDLNQVTDVKVDKIQKYLDLPILRTERLRNVPLAAKYLCLWLRASNKLVKETKAAKADNAAAGKARKLLEAKISRLNGDRADQERLYEEYRRLSREYKELVVFKRELIGQYAVIKEIFSENSIFDQQESNPNRNISESQWIQQVKTKKDTL